MWDLRQLESAVQSKSRRAAPSPVQTRSEMGVPAYTCDVRTLADIATGPRGEAGRVAGAVVTDREKARLVPVLVWRI